ncbi:hypothetical protein GCM10010873_22060 [Cypionkella aquatica]|uniref:Phosphoadenosine phosphosulfate reductase n=1 Tax=Cypionkella aquatica TaxID=1756042 RepID=A0AA37TTS3_9RHOB|nr:phosphoadenosine phosphosulfate reductase [Cypionkella aquatica]GLS87232.1 hypothetical protein GCM10010873_22060 [Cypionkella aquatica]
MTDLAETTQLPQTTQQPQDHLSAGIMLDDDASDPYEIWEQQMEQATEEAGYFHSVGDKHWAYFADESTTLLVSFETIASVLARPGQMPLADSLAKAHGWSVLSIISDGDTWFRDPAVYGFFDRQVDDAFFEDFDQVLFYGAGMGGYAACAFAVTAPGAQVLALNPRATLDPAQSRWDNRDRAARRLDFTSRYGYAPDMLEGAAQAVLIHDPTIATEAMHAALFRAPYITRISTRYIGDSVESALSATSILPKMVDLAMAGNLSAESFAKLWRVRRNYGPYLNSLLAKAEGARRDQHALMICRSVTSRLNSRNFARRLAKLKEKLATPETTEA